MIKSKIVEEYPIMAHPTHHTIVRRNKITKKQEVFLLKEIEDFVEFCKEFELYPRTTFECRRCHREVDRCSCTVNDRQRLHTDYIDILPKYQIEAICADDIGEYPDNNQAIRNLKRDILDQEANLAILQKNLKERLNDEC